MAGDAIGSQYRLVRAIGRGAMGTVWEADGPTGRVAIKVLRADVADDPEVVERFLRERAILLTLRSPHIVSVRDLVSEGSQLAIVMDLVDGEQLRDTITREGTLAPPRAVAITGAILDGLAAAHAQGVVHRDVKPENILLHSVDGTEQVALVDFGVAWITEHATAGVTDIVGTPNYMAPEIIDGGAPDDRADVYATGVVLYELLFGRPPFGGGSIAPVRRAQREEPLTRPSDVPAGLWTVLAAMLAIDPAVRPSAAGAAAALDRLPPGGVPVAPFAPEPSAHVDHPTVREPGARPAPDVPPRSARRPRRAAAIVAGVLAVAVVGGAVVVRLADRGSSAPCARGRPFTPGPAAFGDDIIVTATDDAGASHAGKFFDGVWLGFGNSGLAGTTEATAMQRAGALSASLPTQEIPFEEYRALANRPRDGSTYREWSARRRGAPLVYLVAVGGTVVPTDAAGIRGIGRDPGRAVLVPRYAFDRFARTPPADGTIFRMGATTHLVRSGTRRTVEPCSGVHAVRVPDSNEFLARIPPAS